MTFRRQLFRFSEVVPLSVSPVLMQFLRDLIFAIGEDATTDRRLVRRGDVTFATSATASVTFDEDLKTTSYSIAWAPDTAETFHWTSKASTGFTLNSSNAASTAVVDWIIRIDEET